MRFTLPFLILMSLCMMLWAKTIDEKLRDARIKSLKAGGKEVFKGKLIELDEATDGNTKRRRRSAKDGDRWPNAVVPYVINSEFTAAEKTEIEQAMAEMEKETCLDFVKRQSFHRNYLKIISADGCWSHVGVEGGEQELSLAKDGCVDRGTIFHELMHAVGVHHQHNRPDRDDHVTILLNNVLKKQRYNFDQQQNSLTYGIPYQYRSIMHYGRKAFSSNDQDVIITKDQNYMDVIGNAETLAKEDIQLMNKMYNCGATGPSTRPPPPSSSVEPTSTQGASTTEESGPATTEDNYWPSTTLYNTNEWW